MRITTDDIALPQSVRFATRKCLELGQGRKAQMKEHTFERKKVSTSTYAQYPAVAVLNTAKFAQSPNTQENNQVILKEISASFNEIRSSIDKLSASISPSNPPIQLDVMVEETLAQMQVSPERRQQGDKKSQAILDWLDKEKRKDNVIKVGGTLLTGGLTIASFFSPQFAVPLRGLAAATGLGTAAYELPQLEASYDAAQAGSAGGQKLTRQDIEEARFHLMMGRLNLVLAALDIGEVGVEIGIDLLLTAKAAKQIATLKGAEILAKLSPEQIVSLEKVRQLQQANKIEDAELIIKQLKAELGENYQQVSQLWDEVSKSVPALSKARTLEEALPADLRSRIQIEVKSNLKNQVEVHYNKDESKGLITKIYIWVDETATPRDVQLHVDTVRYMQQYAGLSGRIWRVLDRLEQFWSSANIPRPQSGSKEWEALGELKKLPGIIFDRAEQLVKGNLDEAAFKTIEADIQYLQAQINQNIQVLDRSTPGSGVGYIAALPKYLKVNQEAKNAGYPDHPPGYYYEIRGKDSDGKTVYGLRLFEKTSNNYVPNAKPYRVIEQEIVSEDGTKTKKFVLQEVDAPRNDLDRRNDLIKQYGNYIAFQELEKAIADAGLPNDVAAYVRSQQQALNVLHKYDINLTLLTKSLPIGYRKATEEFRDRIIQQLSQKFANQNPEEALKLFQEIKPTVDSRTQGEIFTALQKVLIQSQDSTLGLRNLEGATITNLEGTKRQADRAIEVTQELGKDGAPPPGKYLVDDKGGQSAFKKDQAQAYSDF